jgi:hypothetical protein
MGKLNGISDAGITRLARVAQEKNQPFSSYEGEQIMSAIDSLKERADYLSQDAVDLSEAFSNGDEEYLNDLFNGSIPDKEEILRTVEEMNRESDKLNKEAEEMELAWSYRDRSALKEFGIL